MYRRSSCCFLLIAAAAIVLNPSDLSHLSAQDKNADRIKPYATFPFTRSKACRGTARSLILFGGARRNSSRKCRPTAWTTGMSSIAWTTTTSTPAQWGLYWIQFIQAQAAEKGVTVCTTDMFDDAFRADKAEHTPTIFNDAKHYMFADISQVNSRNYDETHWEKLQWLLRHVNTQPRPSNHTKIYGSGYKSFGTGGPEDGVERAILEEHPRRIGKRPVSTVRTLATDSMTSQKRASRQPAFWRTKSSSGTSRHRLGLLSDP